MLMDDDKKKKKKKEKVSAPTTTETATENSVSVASAKKRRTLVAAIGNTEMYRKHLQRKGDRIFDKKYSATDDYKGYNKEAAEKNSDLREKGIVNSYPYKM